MLKYLLITAFGAIGLLHIYWALGGGRGLKAAIPENEEGPLFEARPGGTLFIALIFCSGALLVFLDARQIDLHSLQGYLYHLILIIFGARAIGEFNYVGFFKRVTHSRFARYDTYFYSPLCASISLIAGVMLWG